MSDLMALPIAPGIYFGMPAADYHAVAAMSNSGVKNITISTMDFWARTPWLNADYVNEETEDQIIGTAYHTRIAEGVDVYRENYAPRLDPEDYPNALRTADELRGALPDGEKKSGKKDDLKARLREADPSAQIWDDIVAEHAAKHAGKTLLSADLMRKIEISAAMIENHPDLSKAFSGGYPEVSVFWIDEQSGVPCKARLDYLKLRAVVDLKTFTNRRGKPIDRAVAYEIASYKYHLQVYWYLDAVRNAVAMLKADGEKAAHGECDSEWLEKLASTTERKFYFVFQQKGVAPVARGYEFPQGMCFDIAKIVARDAKEKYVECIEKFGTDPWIDMTPIQAMEDDEFPIFMTEV